MAPRRRTLSFFLVLLSLNNGLVLVDSYAVGPGTSGQPVLTEYYPSSETSIPELIDSLLTAAAAYGVLTEVLPVIRMLFPGTEQLGLNDVLSFGSYPQGVSIMPTLSNYDIQNPNSFTTYSTSSTYLSPIEVSNSLQIAQPITETLAYPSQVESLTVFNQNYPPITQSVQVERFSPTANVAEVYQTPISVQIPSMPLLSPFIAVATPLPGNLPSQSIIQELYRPNVFSGYPQTLNSEITTVTSVPVETTTLAIPSSNLGCYGQQLPVTLQINMASPWEPEPVVNVMPPPQSATSSSPYNYPSFGVPPYPIVVMEKSKSKWKSILPILMLTLFDSGSSNNGRGCCCSSQCGASTLIPYPIAIPTNNPIICGRSRGKRKNKATSGNEN